MVMLILGGQEGQGRPLLVLHEFPDPRGTPEQALVVVMDGLMASMDTSWAAKAEKIHTIGSPFSKNALRCQDKG